MDKFTAKALIAINCLSDTEVTLEEACDYKNLDFSNFNLDDPAIVETGGFIPFGKNLATHKSYLSARSLIKLWDDIK